MRHLWKLCIAVTLATALNAQAKPTVVVTTYPLYEAVQRVGGETVTLQQVIPFGADIHTFRPSPKTMVTISRASLFIYSGAGLEPWSEQLLMNLSEGTRVVDMSRYVTLIDHNGNEVDTDVHADEEPEHFHEDEHEHDDHAGHDHGPIDPHYWLDIDNMIAMTRQAERELTLLQPEQHETYRANAAHFIDALNGLKSAYLERLHSCRQHHMVSNHNAFGYLAHAYGFEVLTVTGLSPDQQPSAKAMARVMDLVRQEGIGTVFFEAFVSDRVSRALAAETGTKVDSLQPLANLSNDEAASKENYITIMRKNLAKIAEALECH